MKKPTVAIVGRPNVGKSTLVNRLLGRRAAITEAVPGVTRDRVPYEVEWDGRHFDLVDTGGWEPRATGLAARVVDQAERAMAEADLVLFVVDPNRGGRQPEHPHRLGGAERAAAKSSWCAATTQ